MKCNEIWHVYMKSGSVWMNLVQFVWILVSLALDEHAKQYVLALFPRWSPRLQQFHMYSLWSFLVAYKFCLKSKYLYFDQSYRKKYQHSQCKINWLERNLICEVKRNMGSTKSLSNFLAFLYIACKHTGLAIHREHSKQLMIMHLSDSHVRTNIYFTPKE